MTNQIKPPDQDNLLLSGQNDTHGSRSLGEVIDAEFTADQRGRRGFPLRTIGLLVILVAVVLVLVVPRMFGGSGERTTTGNFAPTPTAVSLPTPIQQVPLVIEGSGEQQDTQDATLTLDQLAQKYFGNIKIYEDYKAATQNYDPVVTGFWDLETVLLDAIKSVGGLTDYPVIEVTHVLPKRCQQFNPPIADCAECSLWIETMRRTGQPLTQYEQVFHCKEVPGLQPTILKDSSGKVYYDSRELWKYVPDTLSP